MSVRFLARAALASVLALASAGVHATPREPTKLDGTAVQIVTDPSEMADWLRRVPGSYRVEGMVQIVFEWERRDPPYPCIREDGTPTDYCQSIKGKADCIAVGAGPGVQCVFDIHWKDFYEIVMQKAESTGDGKVDDSPTGVFELPGGISTLDPAMALFGLDPRQSRIDYLLVDNKGLPEGGPGIIKGNTATFRTRCVNEPTILNAMKPLKPNPERPNERTLDSCERVVYIDARPDARIVHLTIDILINNDPFTSIQMTLRRQSSEDTNETSGARQ